MPVLAESLPVGVLSRLRIGLFATLLATSSVAFADGDVIIDLGGNTDDSAVSLSLGPGGRIYANADSSENSVGQDGQSHVLAFDADGPPAVAFGAGGKIPGPSGPIAVRADGSVVSGGNPVRAFDANGAELSSFSVCGIFYPCAAGNTPRVYWRSFLPLADGRMYLGGGHRFRVFGSDRWTFARMLANGLVDTAFAGNPDGWIEPDGGPTDEIVKLSRLSNDQFIALGWTYLTGELALSRFHIDGSTDFSFGTNGVLAIGTSAVFAGGFATSSSMSRMPMVVDQAQRILLPGDTNIVARRLGNGAADNTYVPVATDAQTHYLTFAVDSLDRVVVFGERNDEIYVARLLPGGGLDPSFGTGGEMTFSPPAAGTSDPLVRDGIVDAANRPVILFDVVGATGFRDLGLSRLTSGGTLDTTFGAGFTDPDVLPDAFAFASDSAPYGSANFVSASITPTGFDSPTSVRIVNLAFPFTSRYSIGCTNTFTQSPGLIQPGQSICLQHTVPSTPGATITTTVTIGGRTGTYTTTANAVAADVTPDPFTFVDQSGVTPGTLVVSAPITISGITGSAPIAVNFGEYSIGCGSDSSFRSSASSVTNGQTVCVRVRASANFSTSADAHLAVNGVTDTFTATTVAADTTPDAFALNAVGLVAQATFVSSFTITMTGLNAPAPISVTGGEYALGCGAGTFTSLPGTIGNAQTVCVRHVSASAPNTTVTTTLTVGGVSAPFSSTTAPASGSSGGSSGGGGAFSPRDLSLLAFVLLGLRGWQVRARSRRTGSRAI